MNETVVTTDFDREITVKKDWGDTFLTVKDTGYSHTQISSLLPEEEARKIGEALIGDNAMVITDLPEATSYDCFGKTIVKSGNTRYYTDKGPEYIETFAKEQLAIAKFIREHRAEEERLAKLAAEAEAAQQAKRNKRRDELAKQFASQSGNESYRYYLCSDLAKNAIDHIIDLEEAQAGQEAAAKPAWV